MKLIILNETQLTATVGELIKELQKFDKDLPVFTEGCDCTGNAVSVIMDTDGTILIKRDDDAMLSKWVENGELKFDPAEKYKNRIK